jgi:DNA-directed RNA polymerase subunit RPC12/RpoP
MSDTYYVCTACGHFWSSPYPPDDRRCESCSVRGVTTSARDMYDAEAKSQHVIDTIARRPADEDRAGGRATLTRFADTDRAR